MRVLAVGVGVVAVLAMAGCQGAVAGSPTPTTRDATGATSEGAPPATSGRLSPPVEHPKDLRGLDACELLSSEQKAEFSLTEPGKRDTSAWGESNCLLQGPVLGVQFSPDTTLGQGLEQAYRAKDTFDNFAESEVGGYPAVRVDFATQSCGLIVGVSDEQTLSMDFTRISSQAPGKGNPCGFAEQVMGDVVKRLPDA